MRYTVVWRPTALDDLAEIWNQALDRAAVTQAADTIDRELRKDADKKGQLQPAGDRIFLLPPLVVAFTVEPDDCMVTVVEVRRTQP